MPRQPKIPRKTVKRAVITGVGPITSIDIGKEKFWAAITEKRSGIGPVSTFDPSIFRAASAAEVSDWKPKEFFPPHRLKRLDRYAQFGVDSVKLALSDSGLQYSPDDPQERVGVSFGTALGGVSIAESQHKAFVNGGPKSVHQTLALQAGPGSFLSFLSTELRCDSMKLIAVPSGPIVVRAVVVWPIIIAVVAVMVRRTIIADGSYIRLDKNQFQVIVHANRDSRSSEGQSRLQRRRLQLRKRRCARNSRLCAWNGAVGCGGHPGGSMEQ
jgi:hypothetical protein